MKTKSFLSVVLSVSLAVVLAFALTAQATPDIKPVFTGSGPGPVVGTFTFSYDLVLGSADQAQPDIVIPITPPPAVTPPGAGTIGAATFADYVTIYDFTGFIPGSNLQPAGWGFQSLLTGSTPSLIIGITDNPAIFNLTWYKIDSSIDGPVTLSGFSADTSVGTEFEEGLFSGDATKLAPGDPQDGTTAFGGGFTTVPTPPTTNGEVPEPATLLLLGSGLAGLVGWRKWQARKA